MPEMDPKTYTKLNLHLQEHGFSCKKVADGVWLYRRGPQGIVLDQARNRIGLCEVNRAGETGWIDYGPLGLPMSSTDIRKDLILEGIK